MATRTDSASADDLPDRIDDWLELAALVEHVASFSNVDWLFRGASDEALALVPKAGRLRLHAAGAGGSEDARKADEAAVFMMFKQQARAYLPESRTDIEWLAIAQHFGVPTRLLDWSDNLLVAAWFAVQDAGRMGGDAAIWITREVQPIGPGFDGDPLELQQVSVYRPPHATPRMSAQGSVLMICPQPTQEVQLLFKKKIVIRGEARQQHFRERLDAAGLNAHMLFRDLAGLGAHLAWLYRSGVRAGYRRHLPGKAF